MNIQNTFKRYELKYIVTAEQRQILTWEIEKHMHADEFGRSTICNIYYDTPTRLLIRRSMEGPIYKEKLRVRSYGTAGEDTQVFVEIKKKFDGVVYKRRVSMKYTQARRYLASEMKCPDNGQIAAEIDYFRQHYGQLEPAMAIFYDRIAYFGKDDRQLRVTFDDNILWRDTDMHLSSAPGGTQLLAPGESLMEIKVAAGMPMWLSKILNEHHIFKTSFSKYGNAYTAQYDLKNSVSDERRANCA